MALKHAWLETFLNEQEIDEKIVMEVSITELCGTPVEACLFVGEYFFGIVTSDLQDFITRHLMLVRDIRFDATNKTMAIRYFDKEKFTSLGDDKIITLEAAELAELEQISYYLWSLRYRFSNADEYYKDFFTELNNGRIENALNALYTASNLDPMTGMSDVLIGRTFIATGRKTEATVFAAKRWELMMWLNPEVIISEYLICDWQPTICRYLPTPTEEENLANLLLRAVIAKANNDLTACIKCIIKILSEQLVPISEEIKLIGYMALCVNDDTVALAKAEFSKISAQLPAKINEIEIDSDEREKTKEMLDALSDFLHWADDMEKANDAMKKIAADNSGYNLMLDEEYALLAREKQPAGATNISIDEDDLSTEYLLYMPTEIWDSLYGKNIVQHSVYKLFARLRIGEDANSLYKELRQLKNSKGFKIITHNDPEDAMFACMLEAELLIRLGKGEKAIALWNDWGKRFATYRGRYYSPYLRYAAAIANAFKAVAFGANNAIQTALDVLPDAKPFKWVHEFARTHIMSIELNGDGPASEAAGHLRCLDNHMKDLLEFTKIDGALKEEIQMYRTEIMAGIKILDSDDFRASNERQKIKIALAGETSAGKSTFLNRLFKTNLFFVTQEEATGIPTEVHYGTKMRIEVWDKHDKLKETKIIPPDWIIAGEMQLTATGLSELSNIMADLTKVGSRAQGEISRIKLFTPLVALPEDVVLIDTPGFNANSLRSGIAAEVIQDCHVCIFVIDARNALKGREMDILSGIRNEVGKTFLVLNKMDLVLGDDELDCDGTESADLTIERVRKDLADYLRVEKVMVYPVCSLPGESVSSDAQPYVKNFNIFMELVIQEAKAGRAELLVHSFAKTAVDLADKMLIKMEQAERDYEREKQKLADATPADLSLFSAEIVESLRASFRYQRTEFAERMVEILTKEFNMAVGKFDVWLDTITDGDELKKQVSATVERIISGVIRNIEQARHEELAYIQKNIYNETIIMFKDLYSNLPFATGFNDKLLLGRLSGIDNMQRSLSVNWGNIDYEGSAGLGTMIGVGIGALILGPIGGAVGGFLGRMLGGKSIENVKNEVREKYLSILSDLDAKIEDSLAVDIQEEHLTSFFAELYNSVMFQVEAYYTTIIEETNRMILQGLYLERESIHLHKTELQIAEASVSLKNWRAKRLITQ